MEIGNVAVVIERQVGTSLTSAHAAGVGVLQVIDPYEFSEAGGTLVLDAETLTYTSWDEEASTITLAGVTASDHDSGAAVLVQPSATEMLATVVLGDNDQGVEAVVPHQLRALLPVGTRGAGFGETVVIGEGDGGVLEILTVIKQTPEISDTPFVIGSTYPVSILGETQGQMRFSDAAGVWTNPASIVASDDPRLSFISQSTATRPMRTTMYLEPGFSADTKAIGTDARSINFSGSGNINTTGDFAIYPDDGNINFATNVPDGSVPYHMNHYFGPAGGRMNLLLSGTSGNIIHEEFEGPIRNLLPAAGAYNTGMSSSIKAMYVNSSGTFGFQSSAAKTKTDIRPVELDDETSPDFIPFKRVLDLPVVTFHSLLDEENPDSRDWGTIADAAHDLGLTVLVTYDLENEIDGFKYERVGLALQPIVKDHEDRIAALEVTVDEQAQTIAAQAEAIATLTARLDAVDGGGA